MERLLEETLFCDLSSEIEPYEYGEKWSCIEKDMKKIITKDNQINCKASPKKLVLSINKARIKNTNSNQTSPKSIKHPTNLSNILLNENNKTPHEINYYPKISDISGDIILENEEEKEKKSEEKPTDPILEENHQNDLLQEKKTLNSKIITLSNEEFIPFNEIEKQLLRIKSEPKSIRSSSLHRRNTKRESDSILYKENVSTEKNMKTSIFSKKSANCEPNLIIEKCKLTQSHIMESPKIQNNSSNFKSKALEIKNLDISEENKIRHQHKRPNKENAKQTRSLENYKNEINEFKSLIYQKNAKTFPSINTKYHVINNHSAKEFHHQSIVFPVIEKSLSLSKNNRGSTITTRHKKAFSFSLPKSSFQKRKSSLKNEMALTADKKRVQSIKLIVKKQQNFTEPEDAKKGIFEEINLENNNKNGEIRKLRMSELIEGLVDINGIQNMKENENVLVLNGERNSKSCIMKSKEFIPTNFNKKNVTELKEVSLFSDKTENREQKSKRNSFSKEKVSKEKYGKENINKVRINKDENNITLLKIELCKHQSKLLIIKK